MILETRGAIRDEDPRLVSRRLSSLVIPELKRSNLVTEKAGALGEGEKTCFFSHFTAALVGLKVQARAFLNEKCLNIHACPKVF